MVRAMAIEMVVRATCMRRAYSCLVWLVQTGSVAVPVDMPYLITFEEVDCAGISVTASLEGERHQARVRVNFRARLKVVSNRNFEG